MYVLLLFAVVFMLISVKRLRFSYAKNVLYLNLSIEDTRANGELKTNILVGITWVLNLAYICAILAYRVLPLEFVFTFLIFTAACFIIEYLQLYEKIKYNKFWHYFDAFQNAIIGLISVWTILKVVQYTYKNFKIGDF